MTTTGVGAVRVAAASGVVREGAGRGGGSVVSGLGRVDVGAALDRVVRPIIPYVCSDLRWGYNQFVQRPSRA